ncbi:MAG: ArsR family transcriptional regulator [Candidatus Bathyarchaeota archaeon B63]|nr:MAG: ArsR family transcriptional regulator [Candidatus Bathyarchaeota archaeon B63]
MKDFMIIKDPKVARLFADQCRRDILHNLRKREMSPYQLARLLEKNVSSISHHLNVLEKAGLVEKTRMAVKGNLVEKFYRATAKNFVISYTLSEGLIPESEDIAKWSKVVCRRAVRDLVAFGYEVTPEDEEDLFELVEKYSSLKHLTFEKIISQQKKPVSITGPPLKILLSLLEDVQLYENVEFMRIMKSLSEKLRVLKAQ